ncbi:MAG: flavodoxin-dependent (E)-4-hydroxy-3-methylbut-2-enyl-diphosphate synthase [Spirochaetota bacterium]
MVQNPPLHVYIPHRLVLPEIFSGIASAAAIGGVACLWTEVTTEAEIEQAASLAEKQGVELTAVVQDHRLAHRVLHRITPGRKTGSAEALGTHAAAVGADTAAALLENDTGSTGFSGEGGTTSSFSSRNPGRHEPGRKEGHPQSPAETEHISPLSTEQRSRAGSAVVYLSGSPFNTPGAGPGPEAVLKNTVEAVPMLQHKGYEYIRLRLYHPHPVVLFNLNRAAAGMLQKPQVASVFPQCSRYSTLVHTSITLGSLLYEGLAHTVLVHPFPEDRGLSKDAGTVQITARMEELVELCRKVLENLGAWPAPYRIISCPTCGRCSLDIEGMARKVEKAMEELEERMQREGRSLRDAGGLTVAVMGCNVNGPGEARDAHIGISGAKHQRGTIFKGGRPIRTVPKDHLVEELVKYIQELVNEKHHRE